MSSWNRIDLHQHTDHDIDCKGKHVNNNYTHIDYYKWLKEEQVKLKAVTCHNNINIASHIKHAIIIILLVLLGLNTVGKISSGSIILDLVIKFVIAFIGINIVFIIYKNKEIKYVESYIKGILKIFQIRK